MYEPRFFSLIENMKCVLTAYFARVAALRQEARRAIKK
jgi:hypothetical protein